MRCSLIASAGFFALSVAGAVVGFLGHDGASWVLIGFAVILLAGFVLGDGNGRHQAELDRRRES